MSPTSELAEQLPTAVETGGVSLFERLAKDPAMDVAKLRELMDLHDRVLTREAKNAFNIAMSQAQQEMRPVAKDAENPQTRSKYASYFALDRALRPIYTKHGFGLSFDTGMGPTTEPIPEGHIRVLCYVTHSGGGERTYHADMAADGKGAKGGDVMTKTHATGSAMTYGQRYVLKNIFNVAIGEADDDGNAAGGATISADQAATITHLMAEAKMKPALFLKYLKVNSVEEIPATSYRAVVGLINERAKHVA